MRLQNKAILVATVLALVDDPATGRPRKDRQSAGHGGTTAAGNHSHGGPARPP